MEETHELRTFVDELRNVIWGSLLMTTSAKTSLVCFPRFASLQGKPPKIDDFLLSNYHDGKKVIIKEVEERDEELLLQQTHLRVLWRAFSWPMRSVPRKSSRSAISHGKP